MQDGPRYVLTDDPYPDHDPYAVCPACRRFRWAHTGTASARKIIAWGMLWASILAVALRETVTGEA